jgi:tetratricopeptide (TPR) repeat protein
LSKSSKIRRRAQEFLKRGKPEKAVQEYKRLLERESKNPNIYNELGDVYLRINDRIQAVTCFEKAVENYEHVALYNNAAAVCKKILRVVPDRRDTLFKLGELRAKQHFDGDASKYFNQYLDLIISGPVSKEDISEKLEPLLNSMPGNREIVIKVADVFYNMGLKLKAGEVLTAHINNMKRSGNIEGVRMLQQRLSSIKSDLSDKELEKLSDVEVAGTEQGFEAQEIVEKVIEESEAEPSSPLDFDSMGEGGDSGVGFEDGVNLQGGGENEETVPADGELQDESIEEVQKGSKPYPEGEEEYERGEEVSQGMGQEETASQKDLDEGDVGRDSAGSMEEDKDFADTDKEQETKECIIPEQRQGDGGDGGRKKDLAEESSLFSEENQNLGVGQVDGSGELDGDKLAEDITSDVEEDDFKSHYDLGMAYLEMALYKESIKEFQIASRSDKLKLKSLEMIGYCFLQQNMPGLAVKQLKRGFEMADSMEGDKLGLHYNLGLAYEMMGEMEKAKEQFENVYIVDVTFKDIEEKMKKFTTST